MSPCIRTNICRRTKQCRSLLTWHLRVVFDDIRFSVKAGKNKQDSKTLVNVLNS
ncbi:hypothetical protein Syun_021093 [Stephania yunnanensis]|uniref:Uncharacterized protein n=1 Tax=Stephania yunnanensis TaxID=152371 RepID=A0AAP0NS10_9MAGN